MSNYLEWNKEFSKAASGLYKTDLESVCPGATSALKALSDSFAKITISHSAVADLVSSSMKALSIVAEASTTLSFSEEIIRGAYALTLPHTLPSEAAILKGFNDVFSSLDSYNQAQDSEEQQPQDMTDYVTIDKGLTNEYQIPDTIAIPVGNHRVRIQTPVFVSIIEFILTTLITIAIATSSSSSNDKLLEQEIEQTKLMQEGNQLIQQQNQMLFDFLNSADVSSSSEAETIKSLKESFPSAHLNLQDNE